MPVPRPCGPLFHLCLVLLGILAPPLAAQIPKFILVSPVIPAQLGPDWSRIESTPPTLALIPQSPSAPTGDIWIRSAPDGLHLWGRIADPDPGFHWPTTKPEMLASNHIELWLAAEDTVEMPPIGWGNQFGPEEFRNPADCKMLTNTATADPTATRNCERWYARQLDYRRLLSRLFIRQWLLAGTQFSATHTFEDFATTAYTNLHSTLFQDDLPTSLQPKDPDGLTAQITAEYSQQPRNDAAGHSLPSKETGYGFHIVIPYTAFPPAHQLTLANLSLMVDVFSAAPNGRKEGAFATTAPARQWGRPASFNHLKLLAPAAFTLTPCAADPLQTDLYGKSYPAWFLPQTTPVLTSTFALINREEGYLYDPPGVSPLLQPATSFFRPLPGGATLCGPSLAWHKGSAVRHSKLLLEEKPIDLKPLPDGWTLVQSGPVTYTHNPFASGQCGACETVSFNLFAVSPAGDLTTALHLDPDLSGQNHSPDAADLSLSPGWTRVTLFQHFDPFDDNHPPGSKPNWTSTTFCLAGHTYKQCAESKHATPPSPPVFPELRQNVN